MINIEPVLYVGISQSFFAGLLISTKRPITTANRLFASWMFLICIELISALINITVLEMYSFYFVAFTYGPLLYLYTLFLTSPSKKFNLLALLHFVPFIVFLVVSVIFRTIPLMKDLRTFFAPDRFIALRIVYGFCFLMSVSVYSTLTFIEIRRHQNRLQDLVSYTPGVITLNWLKVLSISFYTAYLVLFILGGLNMIGDIIPFDPYLVIFCFITLFSFVYSYYGINQPVIFGNGSRQDVEEKRETEKYLRSGLKEVQAEKYLNILLEIMESKRPYLNGELSINDLSDMTGIPRHHITQVLNEKYGRNFFTFINEYRVREVINRFCDSRYNKFTILAIAFDSGFNSKATFNVIFKNQTGLTPSEFRERNSGVTDRGSISAGQTTKK